MYNTPYQRGSLHIHERLLHNLVLGEEIYQISKLPKQASINAVYYVMRCSVWGRMARQSRPLSPRVKHYGGKSTALKGDTQTGEYFFQNLRCFFTVERKYASYF